MMMMMSALLMNRKVKVLTVVMIVMIIECEPLIRTLITSGSTVNMRVVMIMIM